METSPLPNSTKKSEHVKIRPAILEELPVLRQFEQGIIKSERPFDETLDDDPISYYDIGELITSVNSEVLVAIIDDKIVGSGYAKILSSKPYVKHTQLAYLGFMFVDRDYRGQGVIGHILDGLKQWCKSKGVYELQLEVYDGNAAAVRAYEKAGFSKHLVNMRMDIGGDE